jgi:hypothetical protein
MNTIKTVMVRNDPNRRAAIFDLELIALCASRRGSRDS